jgi:RNA polymerase sigma factor FliA
VVEAIRALAPRDRYVIEQHYFASRLLKEIGDDLGVTESRVSQLHRRALRALEAALRERISA